MHLEPDALTLVRHREAFARALAALPKHAPLALRLPRSCDALAAARLILHAARHVGAQLVPSCDSECPTLEIGESDAPLWRLDMELQHCGALWRTAACRSWWAFELVRGLCNSENLAWIGALGTMPQAAQAPLTGLRDVRGVYTTKFLKLAAHRVEGACRAAPDAALQVLAALEDFASPRDLMIGEEPTARRLGAWAALAETAMVAAQRVTPTMAGHLIYLGIGSPCVVEDWLAHFWCKKHPRSVVLVSNEDKKAATVRYVARSGCMDPADFFSTYGWPSGIPVAGCVDADMWRMLLQRLPVPRDVIQQNAVAHDTFITM